MRASIFTLGCRLNQAESAQIENSLVDAGFEIVDWGEKADLIVINSCTVTSQAARKTRQLARSTRRQFPQSFLVLVGCDANVDPEKWVDSGVVDLLVPNPGKGKLLSFLPESLTRPEGTIQAEIAFPSSEDLFTETGRALSGGRTRANIKIQEGCDFRCSYCIVPDARGPARSRSFEDILRESREVIASGIKEIVLTGVNIAAYSAGEKTLVDVISAILSLGDGFRLRLSSTEPGDILPQLLDLMEKNPRICRFLHLPLQNGCERILRKMKRRYSLQEYAEFADQAARRIPDLRLGSDIIVGFPGETDEDFETGLAAVERLPINHLHVFSYSVREGTPAATFPGRVSKKIMAERHQRLSEMGQRKSLSFAENQVGKIVEIVTEEKNLEGNFEGWSDNYLRLEIVDGKRGIEGNQLLKVKILSVTDGLHGKASVVGDGCLYENESS